jgi:Cellulose binding domain
MSPAILAGLCALACAGCAEAEELGPDNLFHQGGSAGSSTSSSGIGSSSTSGSVGAVTTGGNGGAGNTGSAGAGNVGAGTAGGSGTSTTGGSGGALPPDDGGRGGASSDAAVDRPVVPTMGLSVLYKAVGTNAMANAIQCELTINDAGPETVPLSELTLRYYFTNEIVGTQVIDIGFSGLNPGFHDLTAAETKQVVAAPNPTVTADSYVEFGFTGGAGPIAPNQSVIIAWQYHGQNFPTLTQSNDYSFDPTKTTATAWDRVVLVRGGNAVWGTPP